LGGTFVDIANFVGTAGVKKDPFGSGGFTGINMGNNADVADPVQRDVALFDSISGGDGHKLIKNRLLADNCLAWDIVTNRAGKMQEEVSFD